MPAFRYPSPCISIRLQDAGRLRPAIVPPAQILAAECTRPYVDAGPLTFALTPPSDAPESEIADAVSARLRSHSHRKMACPCGPSVSFSARLHLWCWPPALHARMTRV